MSGLFKILFGNDLKFPQLKSSASESLNNRRPEPSTPQYDRLEKWIHSGINSNLNGYISEPQLKTITTGTTGFARAALTGVLLKFSLQFLPVFFKKNALSTLGSSFSKALLNAKTWKFGIFLGLLSGISKVILSIMYELYIKQEETKDETNNEARGLSQYLPSTASLVKLGVSMGGVGTSLVLARVLFGMKSSTVISHEMMMFLLSKAGEGLFWDYGVRKLGFPVFKQGDMFVYVVACTLLFFCTFYEPQALRTSYWSFIMRQCGNTMYGSTTGTELLRTTQLPPNLVVVDFPQKYLHRYLTAAEKELDIQHNHFFGPVQQHDLSEL
jgi:hypothetical protein